MLEPLTVSFLIKTAFVSLAAGLLIAKLITKTGVDIAYYVCGMVGVVLLFHSQTSERSVVHNLYVQQQLRQDALDYRATFIGSQHDVSITYAHESSRLGTLLNFAQRYCRGGSKVACNAAKFVNEKSEYTTFGVSLGQPSEDYCSRVYQFRDEFYSFIEKELFCSGTSIPLDNPVFCVEGYPTEKEEMSISVGRRSNFYLEMKQAVLADPSIRDVFGEVSGQSKYTCGREYEGYSINDLKALVAEMDNEILPAAPSETWVIEQFFWQNYWPLFLIFAMALKLAVAILEVIRKISYQ